MIVTNEETPSGQPDGVFRIISTALFLNNIRVNKGLLGFSTYRFCNRPLLRNVEAIQF